MAKAIHMPEEAKRIFEGVTCNTCPFRKQVEINGEDAMMCAGSPPQLLVKTLGMTKVPPQGLVGSQTPPGMQYHFGYITTAPAVEEGGIPCAMHPVVQQRIKKIYDL